MKWVRERNTNTRDYVLLCALKLSTTREQYARVLGLTPEELERMESRS